MMRYRHEIKHTIHYGEYLILKSRLKFICKLDRNGQEDGTYHIRSLYFDSYTDKALREKLDGVSNREKFRLRYYNHDTTFIRLEKKCKTRGLCYKESKIITLDECESLLKGDIDFLKQKKGNLYQEFYKKLDTRSLVPKTVIDYTREAYIFPAGNVRITFDSDIRTSITSQDFLNTNLPTIRATDYIILEVKYDDFLPGMIKDALQTGERNATAFSKYAAGRII